MTTTDTIVALASPSGAGAIAVIRVSGPDALKICSSVFKSIHGKDLMRQKSHTIHLGHLMDGERALDEFLCIAWLY